MKSPSESLAEHDAGGEDSSSTGGTNASQHSETCAYFASSPALTASHVQEMSEVLGVRTPSTTPPSANWAPTHSRKLGYSVPGVSEVQEMCFSQADNIPYSDMDIGLWVGKPMTDKERYDLLMKTWRPGQSYHLPHACRSGKKRYLSQKHLDDYTWLAFSHAKSGLYCKFCVAFSQREGGRGKHELRCLVTKPLTRYDRLSGADGYLKTHTRLSYHQTNQLKAEEFLK